MRPKCGGLLSARLRILQQVSRATCKMEGFISRASGQRRQCRATLASFLASGRAPPRAPGLAPNVPDGAGVGFGTREW